MQLSETIADEAPPTSIWAAALAHGTEVPAALLVLAEIVILGGGAFTRYALHQPITWTDELASILFVWLAMLGAVIALRRGEHMQLTTFVKDVRPETREWLDALGMFLVMAFLLLLAGPAYEHFHEELEVTTPVLEISEGYRTGAVLVGTGLMSVFGRRVGRQVDDDPARVADRMRWNNANPAMPPISANGTKRRSSSASVEAVSCHCRHRSVMTCMTRMNG